MQRIYRGYSYTCTITHTKPTHPPRAVNWRYHSLIKAPIEAPPVNRSISARSVRPRVINWRYQILSEV